MGTSRIAAEQRLGSTLGGRYTLVRVAGIGGHGAVFEARHVLLDQSFAVKVIDIDDARPAAEARFFREARAAARVDHPHVVRVFDLGRDDAAGCLFLAQELVRGETLRDWLEEHLVASPREAWTLLAPVMEGLAAAHSAGVVHRDVKPENVLLATTPRGLSPRVIDFGVAFLTARDDLLLTGDQCVGTPAYMAPEQARGARDLDLRVDVWAVGVMLYELLLGRRPYDADGARATLAALAHAEPIRFERHAPASSPALCALIERALAPSPEDRFSSMDALRDALAACPEVRDPEARWEPRAAMASVPTRPEPPTSAVAAPARPRATRRVAGVASALFAAALAGSFASRARATKPAAPPVPRFVAAAPSPPTRPPSRAELTVSVAHDAGVPPLAAPSAVAVRSRAGSPERVPRAPRVVPRGVNGAPILAPPGVEEPQRVGASATVVVAGSSR